MTSVLSDWILERNVVMKELTGIQPQGINVNFSGCDTVAALKKALVPNKQLVKYSGVRGR